MAQSWLLWATSKLQLSNRPRTHWVRPHPLSLSLRTHNFLCSPPRSSPLPMATRASPAIASSFTSYPRAQKGRERAFSPLLLLLTNSAGSTTIMSSPSFAESPQLRWKGFAPDIATPCGWTTFGSAHWWKLYQDLILRYHILVFAGL